MLRLDDQESFQQSLEIIRLDRSVHRMPLDDRVSAGSAFRDMYFLTTSSIGSGQLYACDCTTGRLLSLRDVALAGNVVSAVSWRMFVCESAWSRQNVTICDFGAA